MPCLLFCEKGRVSFHYHDDGMTPSQSWDKTAATLKLFTHWTFYSQLTCSYYGGKSYTTYWYLVLCYSSNCAQTGYRTIRSRHLLKCKFLDFKSIHEHEKYIDICLCLLMLLSYMVLALFCPFCCPHTELIVPLLLSVHRVNSALFLPFTTLIVPFFFRSQC